jgi:hypothetical protein
MRSEGTLSLTVVGEGGGFMLVGQCMPREG